jgi:hypothetical protein
VFYQILLIYLQSLELSFQIFLFYYQGFSLNLLLGLLVIEIFISSVWICHFFRISYLHWLVIISCTVFLISVSSLNSLSV